MERFFKDPTTIRKFRTGPLGLNIQQLADELFHLGYTRLSIRVRIQSLARFGCWLKKCHIPLQDLTLGHRRAVAQYVSANPRLMRFRIPKDSQPYDDCRQIMKTAQDKRKGLEDELARVPEELRAWRIQQILEWRGNAFDTSFRQVLNSGLKLWLAKGAQ